MAILNDAYRTDIAFTDDYVLKASGDLSTVDGLTNLKNALFRRLVTQPGSLAHRPNYGVGVKDFQNALSTRFNQEQLAARINDQFLRDPRVEEVLGVSIADNTYEPQKSVITVRVRALGYSDAAMEFVPFGGEIVT